MKKYDWNQLKGDMLFAWQQCIDEGLAVEQFKNECKLCDESEKYSEQDAEKLYEKMLNSKMRKDFPFYEPNDFDEILSECTFSDKIYRSNITPDKIKGAWAGRICGCMLGKPLEGQPLNYRNKVFKAANNLPITRYLYKKETPIEVFEEKEHYDNCFFVDNFCVMPGDDDTNYTVLSMRLYEKYGENFTSDDVLDFWLLQLPFLAVCTAERVAYKNALHGIGAPQSALINNPYREYIGAQVRVDFYGYVHHGQPEKAIFAAWKDGRISHVKNGLYGGMLIAAITSLATCFDNTYDLVKRALDYIPKNSRLKKYCNDVITLYDSGEDFDGVLNYIRTQFPNETNLHTWVHVIPNALIVISALLYGKSDFSKSITLAVSAGFDTDCNGATVGSIVGLMNGFSKIDEKWYTPINQRTKTNLSDVPEISFDQLTERTLKIINSLN